MLKDVSVLNIQSRVGGLTNYLKILSNQWKNGTGQETKMSKIFRNKHSLSILRCSHEINGFIIIINNNKDTPNKWRKKCLSIY